MAEEGQEVLGKPERKLVAERTEQALANIYIILVMSIGHEEAGNVVGKVCYPALVEAGWIPPNQIVKVMSEKILGPKGKAILQAFRPKEDQG
jgi:hypothetical protein